MEEPERAEGRFGKAFALAFPMGVADLRQPRLPGKIAIVEAVQHLLRYGTGHVHKVNDGHRLLWALFNTVAREVARDKGALVHKSIHQDISTKQDLLELVDTQANLVHRVA